jgi:phosphoglycolate phosphatase-like HAD superfamily hydrolase
MYKHIIFDVDGTLIDTEKVVIDAYQAMIFKKHGRYFTEEEMIKGYGVPTRQTLAIYGFTDIDQAVSEYYNKYLIEGYSKCSPFAGVIETLDWLKENKYFLGVVTSRTQNEINIDPCLQGFISRFGSVVSSDDTALHKPNPDPLLKAMEKMHAIPENTLYIGDTFFDRQCAKNAGVKFALALWGSNNAENIDADYFLKKPKEILQVVQK